MQPHTIYLHPNARCTTEQMFAAAESLHYRHGDPIEFLRCRPDLLTRWIATGRHTQAQIIKQCTIAEMLALVEESPDVWLQPCEAAILADPAAAAELVYSLRQSDRLPQEFGVKALNALVKSPHMMLLLPSFFSEKHRQLLLARCKETPGDAAMAAFLVCEGLQEWSDILVENEHAAYTALRAHFQAGREPSQLLAYVQAVDFREPQWIFRLLNEGIVDDHAEVARLIERLLACPPWLVELVAALMLPIAETERWYDRCVAASPGHPTLPDLHQWMHYYLGQPRLPFAMPAWVAAVA